MTLSQAWCQQRVYLKTLEDGWKGPGTLAPDDRNLSLAEKTVLKLLSVHNVPEPQLFADSDGSAELHWPDKRLSVTLDTENGLWLNVYQCPPQWIEFPLAHLSTFAANEIAKLYHSFSESSVHAVFAS